MKLNKLFNLKLRYLINKSFLLVLFIIYLLLFILFFIEASNSNDNNSYKEAIELYISNSFMYLKLILVIFSAYLFSYSISIKNDFLIYLLMPIGVSKSKSLVVSILINCFILFIVLISLIFIFVYIGLFMIDSFYINIKFIKAFFSIYLIIVVYGLYAHLFMQLFKNSFSMIIVICFYAFSNNLYENESNSFLYYLFPNTNYLGDSLISIIYLIIFIFLNILINISIYNRRDLNY